MPRPGTIHRYIIATNDQFQTRVLMLALQHAHTLMNQTSDEPDTLKLKAKATELINQPEQCKERLALSTAAVLTDEELFECIQEDIPDEDLLLVVENVFDALAGVTPPAPPGGE